MSRTAADSARDGGANLPYQGRELDLFEQAAHWKRYVARHLSPYVRGNVLEVGAGIGATTEALLDGSQTSWTCLEPDEELAERLRARFPGPYRGVPVSVLRGTTEVLPDDVAFDCVLYVDVLEHLDDDTVELRRAATRLAPGGAIVAVSPACPWLYSPFDRHVGHRRRYSGAALLAATPGELRLERVWHLDAAGLLASLANRMWLSQALPSPRQILIWDRWLVPISRALDPVLGYTAGRSIASIWRRAAPTPAR